MKNYFLLLTALVISNFLVAQNIPVANNDTVSIGKELFKADLDKSYDSLNINNINAGFNSDGYLFCKIDGGEDFKQHFEYPAGSGKHTIFSSALWIGGLDQNDSLHLAAQRYKQIGIDFQFGPISNNYEGVEFFTKWNRLWKISKEEIDYHRNNFWKNTYEPVEAIINWPGNGDISNGQTEQLAPYFDSNENGIYDPMSGDYPLIRGDQTVLFIFNDDMIHSESQGGKLNVELHGMAYAFDDPTDEMLNNTVFVHYDIYNRSENTYYHTYLGLFTDTDIGYSKDDFIGCNVGLGSFFGYNGTVIDGNGEPGSYGENPPTQSVTILAGPTMDEDNIDNPDGGCDNSINGLNFGDGIIDNERLGMTRFMYFNNGGNQATSDPEIAPDYYNLMRALWRDGTFVLYGGTGYLSSPGAVGPYCNFMFPGDSDPCNWGTNGVPPGSGYNLNGKYWTEETGDNGTPNQPGDRRGLPITGPFTFETGERQELELAFSVGQGENGPESSVEQLFENLTTLFQLVDEGEIIVPNDYLAVEEHKTNEINLVIYPNPTENNIFIKIDGDINTELVYHIFNNQSKLVSSGEVSVNTLNSIDIQNLDQGFYIIQVQHQGIIYSEKFIKM